MQKPTKPTDLMPRSFGGVKNNFSQSLQTSGYEDGIPAIYGGDNLNYQLNATGKELDYCESICDFINATPIGKTYYVDENNELVYGDLIDNNKLTKQQISNCVLEAPNGVYSISNRNLTFKGGLKVLIPYGRNTDFSLKNIEYTLPNDVTVDYSSFATGQRRVCFLTGGGAIVQCGASSFLGAFLNKSKIPTTLSSTAGHFAYANYENLWYNTSGSTTADWQPYYAIPIVPITTTSATAMSGTSLFSRPVKLADTNMVDGNWTLKDIRLANDVTLPKTNDINYSLEDYLPKDHFCYEVLVSATADCSNSGTHAMVYVNTSLITQAQICRIQNVAGASVSGCSYVPIGTDRTITVEALSTLAGTFRLWIRGYRRMGLNG